MTTRAISVSEVPNRKPRVRTTSSNLYRPRKPVTRTLSTPPTKPTACENLNNVDKKESQSWLYKVSNKASNLVFNTYYGTPFVAKKVVSVTKEKISNYKENREENKTIQKKEKAEKRLNRDWDSAIKKDALRTKKIEKKEFRDSEKKERVERREARKAEKAEKRLNRDWDSAIKKDALRTKKIEKEKARDLKNKARQEKKAIRSENRKKAFANMKKWSKKAAKAILFSPVLVPAAVLKVSAKLTAMGAKALYKGAVKPVAKFAAKQLKNGVRWLAGSKLATNIKSGLKAGKEKTATFFRGLGNDVKNSGIVQGWKEGRTKAQSRFQAPVRSAGRD